MYAEWSKTLGQVASTLISMVTARNLLVEKFVSLLATCR